MLIKIHKLIADRGYCSRRKAEQLVEDGKVKINGTVARKGARVKPDAKITVEGKPLLGKKKNIYILLNKPLGYVCSNHQAGEEKLVFDLVDIKERLFVVGRLDKDSHGLVILTNDGDFTYRLSHPSFECEKEYRVTLDKNLRKEDALLLLKGVDINEKTPAKAKSVEKIKGKKCTIVLTEGKHRQIRRSFSALNYTVKDLQRVRISNYQLGGLKKGVWRFFAP